MGLLQQQPKQIVLRFPSTKTAMTLHKHTLNFSLDTKGVTLNYCPQIGQIVRKRAGQQIQQHSRQQSGIREKNLIYRTKQMLNKQSSTFKQRQDRASSEVRRGTTSFLRTRRDAKLSETKKQLQFLNSLCQTLQKDNIRRYRQQLQQQQAQIRATVNQYNLRRNRLTPTPKTYHSTKITKALSLKAGKEDSQPGLLQRGITGQSAMSQFEVQLDRIGVYQRIIGSKRKNKSRIAPWTSNTNQE